MSRCINYINNRFSIVWGNDHVLGLFIQVTDLDFMGDVRDRSGEGYVFDWDQMFGTSISHLKDEVGDFKPGPKEEFTKLIDLLKKNLNEGKIFNKYT